MREVILFIDRRRRCEVRRWYLYGEVTRATKSAHTYRNGVVKMHVNVR